MPLNSTSKTSPPPLELMERVCSRPWEAYLPPIKMAENVWYISGNDWVACYLIDTGDGLILIDTAMQESLYLLVENVHRLGYKMTDIKKILLSHAHIDHIGAARPLQELTGAEIYIGERDLFFLHERKDLIMAGKYRCADFEPDHVYHDDKPITLGSTTIRTVSTPGHTPGCTSFFFEVKDRKGNTLTCAMHGGVGLNITKDFYEETGLPATLREEYIEGLRILDKKHVDITLPSHTNQVGILLLVDQITDDFNPFIDPSIWHELMNERLERALEIVRKEEME
jgi:metallo-beta-lactamase class B